MAVKDNKNIWIIVVVAIIAAVFLISNFGSITGQQAVVPKIVRAHSCDADDTCEILNASIRRGANVEGSVSIRDSLSVQGTTYLRNANLNGDIFLYKDIKPEGRTCAAGQTLRKVSDSGWECANLGGGALDCTQVERTNNRFYSDVTCATGYKATGGGGFCDGTASILGSHIQNGQQRWLITCSQGSVNATAEATCCRII